MKVITNYNFLSKQRRYRGGGVALYIKYGINNAVRDDLGAYSDTDFQCV